MKAPTEIVFLPGFDGTAELRASFVAALQLQHPARAISYPNRALGSLNGYCRYAASQVPPQSRHILIAESFSGLVAARWASMDPHVIAVVLCASFARNPVRWAASVGAALPSLVRLGVRLLKAIPLDTRDPLHVQWSRGFTDSMLALDNDVIAERLRIIATEDVSHELSMLRVPIVLLQFDRDQVIDAAAQGELEAVCHNAQVLRFPGPHFALEVAPRKCAELIGGKLKSVLGGNI